MRGHAWSGMTVGVLASMLTLPGHVAADSDGYYCTGPGYLAYEIRFSMPALRVAGGPEAGPYHALHVVRFSADHGIVSLSPIRLEDFQVYVMECGSTTIDISGSGGIRYVVDLSNPGEPEVATAPADFDPARPGPPNLGHWGQPEVVDLEGDVRPGEFQLVISRVSRPVEGGIEHYTVSRLLRRDPRPDGLIVDSVTLFEGIFLETID